MLLYIILYYTALYYIILHYIILCCFILHYIILHYIILYYIILYYIILYYITCNVRLHRLCADKYILDFNTTRMNHLKDLRRLVSGFTSQICNTFIHT
jgi:hypothetical protein